MIKTVKGNVIKKRGKKVVEEQVEEKVEEKVEEIVKPKKTRAKKTVKKVEEGEGGDVVEKKVVKKKVTKKKKKTNEGYNSDDDFNEMGEIGGNGQVIVVIEHQPKTNMPTMKMAAQITMFYAMKKVENSDNNYFITKIVGYSAKNKMKYYVLSKDEEPIPAKILNLQDPYGKRKKLSIEYTRRILSKRPLEKEFNEFFLTHKKKDDLSDCYLQGLSYISRFKKNIKKGTILLSIDPGTINFSFCLLDVETEKILDWSVDSIVDHMHHRDDYNAMALYKHLTKKDIIKRRIEN